MIEARLLDAGIKLIAGVDEAGRGACAGPLVVAAVLFENLADPRLALVRDSKLLTARQRELLFESIKQTAVAHSIIIVDSTDIDRDGIQRCNIEGMRRAIQALDPVPDYALSDGYVVPGLTVPNLAIWKGDQISLSIAAASILAKVARDRIMTELDLQYPGYGFAKHKGYGTSAHHEAIANKGASPIHRFTFANVASLINK